MTNDITPAIAELVEIKDKLSALNARKAELEAVILKQASADLANTKYKTVTYLAAGASVVAQTAESVKVAYPAYLKHIFGDAYADAVKEEPTYKLSAPAARMLGGIAVGRYIQVPIRDILARYCTEEQTELLAKKVRGKNYDRDKAAIIAVTGCTEAQAEEIAYLATEAAVWEEFCQMCRAKELTGSAPVSETTLIRLIEAAVIVEQTPKITVEAVS